MVQSVILDTYELAKHFREEGITVISGFHSPMETVLTIADWKMTNRFHGVCRTIGPVLDQMQGSTGEIKTYNPKGKILATTRLSLPPANPIKQRAGTSVPALKLVAGVGFEPTTFRLWAGNMYR